MNVVTENLANPENYSPPMKDWKMEPVEVGMKASVPFLNSANSPTSQYALSRNTVEIPRGNAAGLMNKKESF